MNVAVDKDPLVERIVSKIAEAIHPDRVILLGSRATGKARPDSDVDLLVVYSEPRSPHEVELEIQALFPGCDFSLDPVVMTLHQMETQKDVANTLAREVSVSGVVYHG